MSRTETVTTRLTPKMRYLAELAARKQRRSLSSFIEWAIEQSVEAQPPVAADDMSAGRVAENEFRGHDDPLDTPLPCDITVGPGTIRKGVPLRTLVLRMTHLWDVAYGDNAAAPAAPPSGYSTEQVGRMMEFYAGSTPAIPPKEDP